LRSTITRGNAVVAEARLEGDNPGKRGSQQRAVSNTPKVVARRLGARSSAAAVEKGVERRENPLKTTARRAKWRAGVKTDIVYFSSFAGLSGHWRQPLQL